MFTRQYWCALAVFAAMPVWASVAVYQVEADEGNDSSNGYQYAPVNFAGGDSVQYNSNTTIYRSYYSQAASVDTTSSHARGVASLIYGDESVAGSAVNQVGADYASHFLYLLQHQNQTGYAAAPTTLVNYINSNSIRVTNHSYVGGASTTSANRDYTRRIDYVIKTTDVVFVAGAVSDGSSTPLVWAGYNTIAVSGGQTFTPTSDSSTRVGKIHADLWYNELASFSTARVSGYAVGLIAAGQDMNSTNAQKGLVVKSVLMSGAIKESGWSRELGNNLSVFYGAGTANYERSLSILTSGEKTLASVQSNKTVNSSSAANATEDKSGWAYSSSTPSANSSTALILHSTEAITEFTATLNWYVTYTTSNVNTTTYINTNSEIFPHLILELCTATLNEDGSITIGNAIDIEGLSSTVTDDNVQHLYATDLNLSAGYYALVVTNISTDGATSDYALSYLYTVPEPASIALLGLGGAALLVRRKRA